MTSMCGHPYLTWVWPRPVWPLPARRRVATRSRGAWRAACRRPAPPTGHPAACAPAGAAPTTQHTGISVHWPSSSMRTSRRRTYNTTYRYYWTVAVQQHAHQQAPHLQHNTQVLLDSRRPAACAAPTTQHTGISGQWPSSSMRTSRRRTYNTTHRYYWTVAVQQHAHQQAPHLQHNIQVLLDSGRPAACAPAGTAPTTQHTGITGQSPSSSMRTSRHRTYNTTYRYYWTVAVTTHGYCNYCNNLCHHRYCYYYYFFNYYYC